MAPAKVHYHVRELEKVGLLRLVETREKGGQGGIDVGFGPILLSTTPQSMIGRVLSVIETGMFGMSLISVGLAGYLGQFIPVGTLFGIGGALIAVAGIFGWFSLPAGSSPQEQAWL